MTAASNNQIWADWIVLSSYRKKYAKNVATFIRHTSVNQKLNKKATCLSFSFRVNSISKFYEKSFGQTPILSCSTYLLHILWRLQDVVKHTGRMLNTANADNTKGNSHTCTRLCYGKTRSQSIETSMLPMSRAKLLSELITRQRPKHGCPGDSVITLRKSSQRSQTLLCEWASTSVNVILKLTYSST